jgi:predicted ATPase
MLTRLHIDNFRCFVNFEYRPGRKQLIVGRNGTGKSSFMDALLFLRSFVQSGADAAGPTFSFRNQPTQWLDQSRQVFELEALLDGESFFYRLDIEPWRGQSPPRVHSETVHIGERPIFEFKDGQVQLFDGNLEPRPSFPADPARSALPITPLGTDKLSVFKLWLSRLFCFRLNPFAMELRAERDDLAPKVDLANVAAWLSHLVQSSPRENFALHDSLQDVVDKFSSLQLESLGGSVRILTAEFERTPATVLKFGFNQLSEGQRCLICLYIILHFVLAKGGTVIIDEPENFIALREIQPWLTAVSDMVEEGRGQIIVISHHPELINQWAPSCGVQFVRDGMGPVRVEPFHGEPSSGLSPAELVARGWENG